MRIFPHPSNIHSRVSAILKAILTVEAIVAAWEGHWLTMVVTLGILGITLFPLVASARFRIFIPPEFELLAIAFIFCSLFLGEVYGYYTRFWWWDLLLHTVSGLLLGMVGFLLVHVMNETREINISMKPGFVALFSFSFAVCIGTLWEIFEFTMDSTLGTNMQKPMLGDPSGLTDTMWDLIVDCLGAAVISIMGYGYLRAAGNESFLERWIHSFVEKNPHLFKQH